MQIVQNFVKQEMGLTFVFAIEFCFLKSCLQTAVHIYVHLDFYIYYWRVVDLLKIINAFLYGGC